jgi:hypothetical protein
LLEPFALEPSSLTASIARGGQRRTPAREAL